MYRRWCLVLGSTGSAFGFDPNHFLGEMADSVVEDGVLVLQLIQRSIVGPRRLADFLGSPNDCSDAALGLLVLGYSAQSALKLSLAVVKWVVRCKITCTNMGLQSVPALCVTVRSDAHHHL